MASISSNRYGMTNTTIPGTMASMASSNINNMKYNGHIHIGNGYAKLATSTGDYFIVETVTYIGRRSLKPSSVQPFIGIGFGSSLVSRNHAKITWNSDGAYFDIAAMSNHKLWIREHLLVMGAPAVRLEHETNLIIGDMLVVFMLPSTFDAAAIELERKTNPNKRYLLDATRAPPIEDCVKPPESIGSMIDRAIREQSYFFLDTLSLYRWVATNYATSFSDWFMIGQWKLLIDREIHSNPKYLCYQGDNIACSWPHREYVTLKELAIPNSPFRQLFPLALLLQPDASKLAPSRGAHSLISNWANHNVSLFLSKLSVPDTAITLFKLHDIDGATLLRLTDGYLQSMGIGAPERDLILSAVNQLNAQYITPPSPAPAPVVPTSSIVVASPAVAPSSAATPPAAAPVIVVASSPTTITTGTGLTMGIMPSSEATTSVAMSPSSAASSNAKKRAAKLAASKRYKRRKKTKESSDDEDDDDDDAAFLQSLSNSTTTR